VNCTPISEEANRRFTNLQLDYKYNDRPTPTGFYYRSDHYNFAKHKIPVIFYFNGTHADYHQPTDDVEKIDFNKIEKLPGWSFSPPGTSPTANNASKWIALNNSIHEFKVYVFMSKKRCRSNAY
jgi:hypothetical protein